MDKCNIPVTHGEFEPEPKKPILYEPTDAILAEDHDDIIEYRTKSNISHEGKGGNGLRNEMDGQKEKKKKKKKKLKKHTEEKIIYADDIKTIEKKVDDGKNVEEETPEPANAFEALKHVKKDLESEEIAEILSRKRVVDSQGFRIIKNEIEPPLEAMTHEDILKVSWINTNCCCDT